jgi:hypothetical protein
MATRLTTTLTTIRAVRGGTHPSAKGRPPGADQHRGTSADDGGPPADDWGSGRRGSSSVSPTDEKVKHALSGGREPSDPHVPRCCASPRRDGMERRFAAVISVGDRLAQQRCEAFVLLRRKYRSSGNGAFDVLSNTYRADFGLGRGGRLDGGGGPEARCGTGTQMWSSPNHGRRFCGADRGTPLREERRASLPTGRSTQRCLAGWAPVKAPLRADQ